MRVIVEVDRSGPVRSFAEPTPLVNLPILHGGNPSGLRRRLGLGEAPWLDFATVVNPVGPPPRAIEFARNALDRADRHPDPGCPALVDALAERHGVPANRVLIGAGVTELMGLLGQSLREVLAFHAQAIGDPSRPLSHLVDPSDPRYRLISKHNELRAKVWGEHVLGWRQDTLPKEANGLFWSGHPDNPTGKAWDRATLTKFAIDTLGLLTVVDESSLPFLADEAERTLVADAARLENLLVLRSFSGYFALPGLRVGYAIGPPDMVTRLRQYQDPWSVTAHAEAAALAALADTEHAEKTRDWMATEAPRFVERLWDVPGLRPAWPDRNRPSTAPPLPPTALVSLTQTDWDSISLQEALARRGFLVRECSDFPGLEVGALLTGPDQLVATRGHLRLAIRDRLDNDQLVDELIRLLASGPET